MILFILDKAVNIGNNLTYIVNTLRNQLYQDIGMIFNISDLKETK